MKKYIPYILGALIIVAVVVFFLTGNNKDERKLDERITLRRQDKIPYGTYVAFNGLKHLFPAASISTSRQEPGYWDSLSNYDDKQAYIVVTNMFTAERSELRRMITFAEKGNDVFICARYISAAADKITGSSTSSFDLSYISEEMMDKDLKVSLRTPPFTSDTGYSYPGKTFSSYFTAVDTNTTEVLGYDRASRINFIHLKAGKGNFYIHMEPLAFSNYFLLYNNNIAYYEKVFSVLPADIRKIVWDEYYINKRYEEDKGKKQGWLNVLFRYRSLKAALLTAIFALLIYVLMEMRRKQRYIPVITKPRNDSLDFVKTIGRLYHDKGDHKNLARKMSAYFLEFVRTKYKIPTNTLDEEFIKALQYKSGAEEADVKSIVSFIKFTESASGFSAKQLSDFHKQLESFYQKT